MPYLLLVIYIVALRNEKGSYSQSYGMETGRKIVALRNEKGSYSPAFGCSNQAMIVALRNEKGSYSKNG